MMNIIVPDDIRVRTTLGAVNLNAVMAHPKDFLVLKEAIAPLPVDADFAGAARIAAHTIDGALERGAPNRGNRARAYLQHDPTLGMSNEFGILDD